MSFINNKKYKEIREASKNGNEKAKAIMQCLYKGEKQDALDRLLDDYYGVNVQEPIVEEQKFEERIDTESPFENDKAGTEAEQKVVEKEAIPMPSEEVLVEEELHTEEVPEYVETGNIEEGSEDSSNTAMFDGDLMDVLTKDIDGLLDTNDFEDLSFCDFLKNKKRDALRAKRNADYFKAYNPESRHLFMENNINDYKKGFDGKLKNIERRFNDYDKSLIGYSDGLKMILDDDVELNMDSVGSAYDEFVDSEKIMNSFGRYWDEDDNNIIKEELANLVAKYGKKNVEAVLNTLRNDNENYKNFLNNQVDTEIDRYSKSLEKILK